MSTGFYRVLETHKYGKKYFKYRINNKIIKKEITRKDIYELKQAVEEAGLLWGITNLTEANKNKGKYNLKALQGRYGEKNDNRLIKMQECINNRVYC